MRDAARELAHCLHLLRLPQGLLRLLQPGLFAQPLRHVRDELIGADGSAPSVAQRAEPHLVIAAVERRVAKFVHLDELLAGERARPDRLHRLSVGGPILEHFEHAVARLGRAHAKNARELGRCGVIDRKPRVVAVSDLDEDVGPVDDIGEHAALGECLGHAALQRLIQLAQSFLGLPARRDIVEHDGDATLLGLAYAEGVDVEPTSEHVRALLEARGLARAGDTAVDLVPVFFERWRCFAQPLAQDCVRKPSLLVESWVRLDDTIVDAVARRLDIHLDDAEPGLD